MAIEVYVIDDRELIDLIEENDISGFEEYLNAEEYLSFPEPEVFKTEEEAIAYCKGICYQYDERGRRMRHPLISSNDYYTPFIDLIKQY